MLDKESFEAWINSELDILFDIYAQDIEAWPEFKSTIPSLVITSAGGMYPFQAEGFIKGYPFYFREEWGSATLSVGELNGSTPYLPAEALYTSRTESNTEAPLDREGFIRILTHLVGSLKSAPFLWEFEAKKLIFSNEGWDTYTISNNEFEVVLGWGATPLEGYLYAAQPSPSLEENGCSPELQEKMWEDQKVNMTPLNQDLRVYPKEFPDFFS